MTMEILNNFSSIYCFIAFVIGAGFMLAILSIAAMGKVKEPRNKVRFFVQKSNKVCSLYLYSTKTKTFYKITYYRFLKEFGLDPNDFADMKEGEIREVFINLED